MKVIPQKLGQGCFVIITTKAPPTDNDRLFRKDGVIILRHESTDRGGDEMCSLVKHTFTTFDGSPELRVSLTRWRRKALGRDGHETKWDNHIEARIPGQHRLVEKIYFQGFARASADDVQAYAAACSKHLYYRAEAAKAQLEQYRVDLTKLPRKYRVRE